MPVVPAPWAFAAIAATRLTGFLCQTCKSKACSSCGLKATEQWIAEQQHILPDCEWQHITFTMPDKLWPAFANNWPLLNKLFACAANTLLKWAKKLDIEIGLFVALHTYGRQLNPVRHTWRIVYQTRRLAADLLQKENR
nr:IS91 family transposase [Serratia proteamaculans]